MGGCTSTFFCKILSEIIQILGNAFLNNRNKETLDAEAIQPSGPALLVPLRSVSANPGNPDFRVVALHAGGRFYAKSTSIQRKTAQNAHKSLPPAERCPKTFSTRWSRVRKPFLSLGLTLQRYPQAATPTTLAKKI